MQYVASTVFYAVIQFIAFLLVVVGTPLDVFRGNDPPFFERHFCITLWGGKINCSDTSYLFTSDEIWDDCPGRCDRFRAAQALAVISIFLYGTAFFLGVLLLFCCSIFRWVCLVLNIVGIFTLATVWAAMVVTYYKDEGESCPNLNSDFIYGSGFYLFLVAWCLDIINIAVLLLPCQERGSAASEKSELEEEHEPEAVRMQEPTQQEGEEMK
ncbi:amastin-like protein [Leishmania donovani]|uniref:Amastin-like protein n=1 Tax=Leishmania donovani TaxID=5661 RepID=A0A3Q8IHZ6_LEIDO|nr:amastin-like protein [Leishmania donovani]AYU82440.1 amastin-like protein [Leishmania donovani]